ncbi:MAG: glycosyltransferase family 2 protein [Mastigocoleus sp.]
MKEIAVLMTCHNRRDITLSCLKALSKQNVDFITYLVDDGSSDGTTEAVKEYDPSAVVIQGNGNLFWVGGMRLAFAEALQNNHDYYLWLNDDSILEPDALSRLLETHRFLSQRDRSDSIIVGSVKDPKTGNHTYGGRVRSRRRFSHTFEAVIPQSEPIECDTMQGNIVLIPSSVAQKVGNVDESFVHTMGDLDYGLRAKAVNCSIWVAPSYLGNCSQNGVTGSWADKSLPVYKRLQKAFQVKNFPLKAWTTFTVRHSGPFWFIFWTFPYLRALIGYRNLSASPTFTSDSNPQIN